MKKMLLILCLSVMNLFGVQLSNEESSIPRKPFLPSSFLKLKHTDKGISVFHHGPKGITLIKTIPYDPLQEQEGQLIEEAIKLFEPKKEEKGQDPITLEDLSLLDEKDTIKYKDKWWSKRSLLNSALSTINKDSVAPLDPFTRQPLPAAIINELKARFAISDADYEELIKDTKELNRIRGEISMGAGPGTGMALEEYRINIEEREKKLNKKINEFLIEHEVITS